MKYFLFFASVIEPVFYKLVYMSIIACVIGITIFAIKKIARKKLASKWISIIWIMFIASLICPIQFRSNFSIYNILPNMKNDLESIKYSEESYINIDNKKDAERVFNSLIRDNLIPNEDSELVKKYSDEEIKDLRDNFEKEVKKLDKYEPNIINLLPSLWCTTVILLFLLYILTYVIFEIRIHKTKDVKESTKNILENCKNNLNIKKKIKIVNQDIINMPSIFGIFNVRILVNDKILELSEKELEYIFMHELAHYKRKDNLLNILITILRCIYIFNPIVFILLNSVKKDLELATDELAMRNSNIDEQKEYCKTLVKLSSLNSDKFLIQTLCLTDEKKNLERRIDNVKLLNKFKEHKKMISIMSVVVMCFIVLILFTQSNNYMSRKEIVQLLSKTNSISNYSCEVNNKNTIIKDNKENVIFNSKDTILEKDGVIVRKIELDENGETKKYLIYFDTNTREEIQYSEDNSYTSVIFNGNRKDVITAEKEDLIDLLQNDNKIYNYKCNYGTLDGREVYIIKLIAKKLTSELDENGNLIESYPEEIFYVDKENGFILKNERNIKNNDEIIEKYCSDYKYTFNNVTNEDIVKPDISNSIDIDYIELDDLEEKLMANNLNALNESFVNSFNSLKNDKNYSYKMHTALYLVDDEYTYDFSFINNNTNENTKFFVRYEDNFVYRDVKDFINKNGAWQQDSGNYSNMQNFINQ